MNTERMITELESVAEKYRNKITFTGEVNITAMCEDVLPKLRKLKEYEDLEEQGLLLKPKCQPGDIVWEANKERKIVSEYEVTSIRYGINKTFHYMWVLRNGIYSNLDGFCDKDINKTVFLTQAEAEEKLKKIESED